MLKLKLTYPSRDEELAILATMGRTRPQIDVSPVATAQMILDAQGRVDSIYLDEKVRHYIVDLVLATRDPGAYGLDLGPMIEHGASPRATIYLALAAKAHALIKGRDHVTPHDVKSIAMDVLRHRVLTSYEAEAAGLGPEDLLDRLLAGIEVP